MSFVEGGEMVFLQSQHSRMTCWRCTKQESDIKGAVSFTREGGSGGRRARQTRKPSLKRRKRRRRNIWHEEAYRILRLIRQRLWSVWFSCKKKKKKGNTNGCDRTSLFSSQTAVQHQTERVCVRPGDNFKGRLRQTHWSYCVKETQAVKVRPVCQNLHWTCFYKASFCFWRTNRTTAIVSAVNHVVPDMIFFFHYLKLFCYLSVFCLSRNNTSMKSCSTWLQISYWWKLNILPINLWLRELSSSTIIILLNLIYIWEYTKSRSLAPS